MMVKEEKGVYETKTPASRADIIAHATKRAITEKMDEAYDLVSGNPAPVHRKPGPAFDEDFADGVCEIVDGPSGPCSRPGRESPPAPQAACRRKARSRPDAGIPSTHKVQRARLFVCKNPHNL